MDEKTFLDESGVSVSNARFVSRGQTYAMSGITSVKSFEQPPSRTGPSVVAFIGVAGLFFGTGFEKLYALVFLAAAAAWWIKQKSEYSVLLNTASGEAKALTSKDGDFIFRVVTAMNNAIVHRG